MKIRDEEQEGVLYAGTGCGGGSLNLSIYPQYWLVSSVAVK